MKGERGGDIPAHVHRPPKGRMSAKSRAGEAQKKSLRYRKGVQINLKAPPWEKGKAK